MCLCHVTYPTQVAHRPKSRTRRPLRTRAHDQVHLAAGCILYAAIIVLHFVPKVAVYSGAVDCDFIAIFFPVSCDSSAAIAFVQCTAIFKPTSSLNPSSSLHAEHRTLPMFATRLSRSSSLHATQTSVVSREYSLIKYADQVR